MSKHTFTLTANYAQPGGGDIGNRFAGGSGLRHAVRWWLLRAAGRLTRPLWAIRLTAQRAALLQAWTATALRRRLSPINTTSSVPGCRRTRKRAFAFTPHDSGTSVVWSETGDALSQFTTGFADAGYYIMEVACTTTIRELSSHGERRSVF